MFTIKDVSKTNARISISSETQEANLSVGEEKKFEISGDNYYDILVKLVSINSLKANLTITTLHEAIPANNTLIGNNNSDSGVINTAGTNKNGTMQTSNWSLWLIIVIVIIVVVAIIMWTTMKKKGSVRSNLASKVKVKHP